MLRKSVETRDWLNTIEPRNVRAVMKRVVEDVTCIDGEVGRLYEEGVRRDRSSDSTKRSTSRPATRSNWSFTPRSVQGQPLADLSVVGVKSLLFVSVHKQLCSVFVSVCGESLAGTSLNLSHSLRCGYLQL